jgi:hypothetical protein
MNEEVKSVLKTSLPTLVLAAGAFIAGRYSVPVRVEEKVRVEKVEVEKQVVAFQEKVRVEKVYMADTKQAIHREEHETIHPGGLTERVKTEDINTEKVVKENAIQYVDREVLKLVEHTTVQERVVEKVVDRRLAQWKVSILAGANFGNLNAAALATPFPKSLLGNPWVIGAHVERRIAGPFFLGLWGTTNKDAGVSAGFEW